MSPHTRQPSRRSLLALAALAPTASALLASCSSSATGTPLTSTVTRETVSLDSVRTSLADAVTACDELGAQLLNHLLTQSPGANALASPLSLALALALVADGATDATTQGYDKLLGVSGQERDQTWSAVQTALNRNDRSLDGFDPGKPPETPLVHVANHVVVVDRKDLTVSQTYLDTVLRWFSAQIEKVPLGDLADNLSKWADKNTAGLIKKTGVQVTGDTALVLQNALLFAAQWDTPFNAEGTAEDTFTRADGSTTQTKFMHGTRIIPYAYGQGWAAVRLGYQGGELDGQGLAMDVVLPNQGTSPADLPPATWAQASAALDQAAAGSDQNEVKIVLPKLDLTSGPVELLEMLKALGLDTSSLDGIALGLSISQVVQQVRLLVDEEGTVAAALTEVGLTAGAAPDQSKPIDFVVDHPYVLRLRDLATGTTLVQAAIMGPAA